MADARRKTTIEERRIVKYCIEHNRNYKETASIYDVSYNQVYSWVKKYDATDSPAEYPIPVNKRIQKYKEKWCA